MSTDVRNAFILAGMLVVYGVALWLYERHGVTQWGETFAFDPRARFARGRRDEMMVEEFTEEPSAEEATSGDQ